MTVSFIVHGAVWPDALSVGRARDDLLSAFPGAQVLEARPQGPTEGAAAAIDRTAGHATGDVLVAIEAGTPLDAGALAAVLDDAAGALVIEGGRDGHDALGEGPAPLTADLVSALAALALPVTASPLRPPSRAPVWALARATFLAAGGLDARLGSVGYLGDLTARLPASVRVVVSDALAADAPAAWPLEPLVASFLRTRNRLFTAFKTADVDVLGVTLAGEAVERILQAWRASGWSGDDFRFGGGWGRVEGRLAKMLWPGRHGASRLTRHEDVLAPLLALDAFLDEVPALMNERAGRVPAPVQPSGEATPPSARRTEAPDRGTVDRDLPRVSVVVVNWNGREHLRACLGSLLASEYPRDRLEVVCVDNGSSDGSADLVRREFPGIILVELDANRGFTGGNEAGVAASHGDVLVFFNNDMRVAPDAIRQLAAALDATTVCAAARVLSWDGRRIDFLRGSLNFEGRGFQDEYGEPAERSAQATADTFFANGGAFAVTRAAYLEAGGFDDSFFAYYDDVDLGWRLRLTGASLRVVDGAVAYHRHGGTARTQPEGQKRFLMERNALWTLLKNYGEPTLRRTLGVTLLLALRRILDESRPASGRTALAALAPWCARIRRRFRPLPQPNEGAAPSRAVLTGFAAESFAALGAALADLPRMAAARARVQGARTATEAEVLSHFGRTFEPLSAVGSYHPIARSLVAALDLPRVFNARTRLLIVSHEAIAANMSGPAVRFLEIGRALSAVARVTIAMPGEASWRDDRCTIAGFDPASPARLRRLGEDADVIFVQGFALVQYPFLARMLVPLVVDLYCPFTIEHLVQAAGDPARAAAAPAILDVQNAQLDAGDFFICASETQRDFWLGNLHSRGRVNPLTYRDDPTLRRLIDVVPFGLQAEPAAEAAERSRTAARSAGLGDGAVMKGARAGIEAGDRVLLWAGSLLDWQDPLTLIRAVAALAAERSDVKLFFMGTKHPNPLVAPMRIVEESRALARELGVLDRQVFFNDWVPYDQRARYLLEADLGVSTHLEHLETHFSFRTRMLDYVWSGLPIVCTRGDVFADLVDARGLGIAVPPGDAGALASAIATMLDDAERRRHAAEQLRRLADDLRWDHVVAPLRDFCGRPRPAADHASRLDALRNRLERKFRLTKWLKRTALRAGISEMRVEQVKRMKAVSGLMSLRNRLALARARR